MGELTTTHSPIILSNFIVDGEKTKIIQLERNDGEYSDEELGNLYTMDYNSNLTEIMGVDMSDKKLDTLISAYNFLKNEHQDKAANKYYDLIKDFFSGNIPDFVTKKMSK